MIKHLPVVLCDIPQKAQRVIFFTCTILMLLICSTCSPDKTPETPPDPSPTPGGGTEPGGGTVRPVPKYTVSFNTNGGTEVVSKTIDSGKVVTKPADPTNVEHGGTFDAWYSDEELQTAYDFDDPVTENLSLYAKWNYMVAYNPTTRTVTGLNPDLLEGDINPLIIPSNFNGMQVDSIGAGAFANEPRIVSLSMAEGIKHIGDSAFKDMDLSVAEGTSGERIAGQLSIPNSVLSLGSFAFAGTGFEGSLALGDSLRTIGGSAFSGCSGFTGSLAVGKFVTTIGASAFRGCSGFTGDLTIGDTVKTIGASAFGGTGFTGNLTIGRSVTIIERSAFAGVGFTGDLTIGESVTIIQSNAFDGAGFTGSITIGRSVTTIGDGAFANITAVSTVIFTSSVAPTNIGANVFSGIGTEDDPLTITVPDGAEESYDDLNSLDNVEVEEAEEETTGNTDTGEDTENNEGEGETFTVTFDANDGDLGQIVARQETKADGTIAEPNRRQLTRDGHTFAGWAGRNADQSFGPIYDFDTKLTGDTTLYAQWTPVIAVPNVPVSPVQPTRFNVTFDANEGNLGQIVARQKTEADSTITAPKPDPTRQGHTFDGWAGRNADQSFGPIYDFDTKLTGDTTLYAQWTQNQRGVAPATTTFTVTFVTNGGGEVNEIVVDSNTAVSRPSSVPVRQGYRFVGWYADEEFNMEYNFNTPVVYDITLYANWTQNQRGVAPVQPTRFTVTFVTNGGGNIESKTLDSGTTVSSGLIDFINNPRGVPFLTSSPRGVIDIDPIWYREATFENEFDLATDPVNENMTLYLKWEYMVSHEGGVVRGFNPALPAGNVNLVIPANINGTPITRIADRAFEGQERITSLEIDNGITEIGLRAFVACTNIARSLRIPNSVRTIANRAFAGCTSFDGYLTLSENLDSIGNNAFLNCSGFSGHLTLPASLVSIGNRTFSGMTGIDSFIFERNIQPDDVDITIGEDIFENIDGVLINGTPKVLDIRVPAEAVEAYRAVSNLSRYSGRIMAQ